MRTQSHPYYCAFVLVQTRYPDTIAMRAFEHSPEPQPCSKRCYRVLGDQVYVQHN